MDSRMLPRMGATMLLLLLGACVGGIRKDVVKTHSEALAPAQDTQIAQSVEPAKAEHAPDQSGFRLLTLNTNALLSRIVLAEKAEHSIDLQTYVFEDDDTGRLVAQALLKAADRGVRVRLLVDDITKKDDSARLFDALDAHPNIEVRVFNPFNSRSPGPVGKAMQMLVEFRRLNRRMHNKSFIVDNKIAVIGGRNIADDYFDASDQNNYRDLDLLAIGPVVEAASHAFDAYWNNEAALPVAAFQNAKRSPVDLATARKEIDAHVRAFADSDYAQVALAELPDGPTADRKGQWFWGDALMAADQPEKIVAETDAEQPSFRTGKKARELMYGAKSELLLLSPYFVPSKDDRAEMLALVAKGVAVRIATNSLSATDQPPVHSAYSPVRRELLAGGVKLYELKARAGVKQSFAQVSSTGVTLHAKAFVVDGRYVFVGSMNMDQRSNLINTEQGIVVVSPPLAKAVADFFTTVTQPANSYRLTLEDKGGAGGADGQILWNTEEGGKPTVIDHEPEVGPLLRGEVLLLKLLPIDGLM